ncbi:peptide chain release factor N(5)-glutamine methyltransferase [Leeia sp.]|uniref:peptide chain release factor N(5)-glutamine methyltransferase n=1 Tax=Leeia sp. TaxID=2884678 RepID=UPI0035B3BC6B
MSDDSLDQLLRHCGLPRLEARLLLQQVLQVNHAWLVAHGGEPISSDARLDFATLVQRRLAGEPIAYLLESREFYGRPFRVTPAVLIPRPDTELLIEQALAHLPADPPLQVLDVGTGSGCIAITLALERPQWQLTALDLSDAALQVAQNNARRLGAAVRFVHSDYLSAVTGQQFDAIVSNPPYIPQGDPHLQQGDLRYEPASALTDGADGLQAYRALAQQAKACLRPGGWLLVEHGYDQGETVPALLQQAGWQQIHLHHDLAGQARVTCAQRPEG